MTIFEGSRYEEAAILRPLGADGESRPTIYAVNSGITDGTPYRNHVVREGERFDVLAIRLWGDPELWWRIANLNPEHSYPDDLVPGSVIRLPA